MALLSAQDGCQLVVALCDLMGNVYFIILRLSPLSNIYHSPSPYTGGVEKLSVSYKLPKAYSTGFIGCMKDVLIDRKELHLVEDAENSPPILYCSAK